MGHSILNGDREFGIPSYYEVRSRSLRVDEQGNRYVRVAGVRWFTNLEHDKRNQELRLYEKYDPKKYPKYDNYDAIEVSETKTIPKDYFGEMGVPISYLNRHCPKQFEIVGYNREILKALGQKPIDLMVNGKTKYARIIIRRTGEPK